MDLFKTVLGNMIGWPVIFLIGLSGILCHMIVFFLIFPLDLARAAWKACSKTMK